MLKQTFFSKKRILCYVNSIQNEMADEFGKSFENNTKHIEKQRFLWYNYLTVGIGPANPTVWECSHAVFIYCIPF